LNGPYAEVAVTLLRALPALEREVPGVRLWLLGDGDRGDEVRRAADETNRQMGRPAAIAVGLRLDVPRFFNLADCVVAVARTAIEGMACARAVIVAGEGGYRGLLTPDLLDQWAAANFTAREGGRALNAQEMTSDIARLLRPETAALREAYGEAGRRYVVENLSIEAITTQILQVYAEVL